MMNTCLTSILYMSILMFHPIVICRDNTPKEPDGLKWSLGGSVGINDFHQRDKYLSPFVFDGKNFASILTLQVQSEQSRHTVDAFFSYGPLDSDIQPRYVREHVASLSYSYVCSVAALEFGGRPLQFSAGGGISSFLLFTDFNTTDQTGYTTYDQSWYWSHSLNIVLSGEYEFDAGKNLAVRLTAPIAALVSRPENERWMSPSNSEVSHNYFKAAGQGKIEYVWSNLVLFTDVEYRQSIGNDFSFLATYRFGYISSGRPAPILSMGTYMNNLSIGILWSM
jgi:hypothetical protein